MPETIGERVGVSRLEKNVFIVMFELIGFIISIMSWSFSNSLNEIKPDLNLGSTITFWMIVFLSVTGILTIHGVYLAFLSIILKRDEEIKELSSRTYKLVTYIVPKKRIVLTTHSKRTMQPYPVNQSEEQTRRLLSSSMIHYICQKLIQDELPTEFNLDLIFKSLNDAKTMKEIEDKISVQAGIGKEEL